MKSVNSAIRPIGLGALTASWWPGTEVVPLPLRTEGTVPLAVFLWALDKPRGVPAPPLAVGLREASPCLSCCADMSRGMSAVSVRDPCIPSSGKGCGGNGLRVRVDFSAPHCVWGGVWGAVAHCVV